MFGTVTVVYRIVAALLTFTALAVAYADASDKAGFEPVSFFSFFTNLSNIFAAAVLLYVAVRPTASARADVIRGAAVTYLAVTFLVFALLLRDLTEELGILRPWINMVLHQLMPVVLMADWLLHPPRRPVGARKVLLWLAFPVLYVCYSLVRGPFADWYPYPFLDPREPGGYAAVAAYSVGIAAVFLAAAWSTNRLGAWAARRRPASVTRP